MTDTDWRHETLSHIRTLIEKADPDVVEEAKWIKPTNPAGVPAWSHDGLICTGEIYKDKVKLTFFQGGAIDDPDKVFTAGDGTRRAIDIAEGQHLDEPAFTALFKRAVDLNVEKAAAKRRK